MESPIIRRSTGDDLESLENLFLSTRLKTFHWCDPSLFKTTDFSIQTEGEIVHVAEIKGGRIVGFISVWEPDNFVHHLYVDEAFQRQGIGSALLDSIRAWLPFPHRLKCLEKNQPAIDFYQSEGWTILEQGSDALGSYFLMEYNPEA